jgi:DNA-binding CsgD family transcriptional regulator
MGDTGPIEALLDGIYDAAVDGNRWPVVLGQLAAHFSSGSAHLSFENVESTRGKMISFGADPAFTAQYGDYYVSRNVLWQEFVRRRLSAIMCDRQVIPKDELRRSEFYNGFLAPQDCDDLLIAPITREEECGSTITLWRSRRHESWTERELVEFRRLAPHLARAVRVGGRFGATEAINTFSADALYRLGRGLFIVTCSAMVLFANGIAEDLLGERSGLKVRQQRLSTEQPAQSQTLHQLISAAAERKRGGSMIVTRGAGAPLLLTVIPVHGDTWSAVGYQPGAMVVTKDLNPKSPRPLDGFSRHYGLTPAETRVAGELLVGDGIPGLATRLAISEATARTHRTRIFQKTGARRQAELVRLILEWSDNAVTT